MGIFDHFSIYFDDAQPAKLRIPQPFVNWVDSLADQKLKLLSKYINKTRFEKYKKYQSKKAVKLPGFSKAQRRKYFLAIKPDEFRERMAMDVMHMTFRRISEVAALRISKVDLRRKVIGFWLFKQHKSHISYIENKDFRKRLKLYIKEHKEQILAHDGYLFWSNSNRGQFDYLHPGYLRRFHALVLRRVNLDKPYLISKDGRFLNKFSTKVFRRSGIQAGLKKSGKRAQVIQMVTGHDRLESLLAYDCIPDLREIREATAIMQSVV